MSLSSLNSRGQTSFEVILITGIVIVTSGVLGSYYLGDTADQTTAIIILKTELLKELNKLDKGYVIDYVGSKIEPPTDTAGNLSFCIKTLPNDAILSTATINSIKDKIAAKTKYKNTANITITLNLAGAC